MNCSTFAFASRNSHQRPCSAFVRRLRVLADRVSDLLCFSTWHCHHVILCLLQHMGHMLAQHCQGWVAVIALAFASGL